MESNDQKTARVHIARNMIQAQAIEAMLDEEGIPCIVGTYESRAYDGVFTPQKGWGEIRVLEEHKDRAGELIRDFLTDVESGAVEGNLPGGKPIREEE
jgi:hypothetical protein